MSHLNWGILATGAIAKKFALGVTTSNTGSLAAVGSRSSESAETFAKDHDIGTAHGSYEELLANPEVDAIYIATPHPSHEEWGIKTAEAGKHILCEKPIGMSYSSAKRMDDAAKANNIALMEAFMYRCHPQTAKAVELVKSRAIGEVKLIQATFGFKAPFNPEKRLFNQALGGGGILDVGGYPVSFARLMAGAAVGQAFAHPVELHGRGHLSGETGVDLYAIADLAFENNIFAQVSASVSLLQQNYARVYGTEGYIEIASPWIISPEGGDWEFKIFRPGGKETETIKGNDPRRLYGIEADHFCALVHGEELQAPGMSTEDTFSNMKTLDLWREAIGLKYDYE